MSIKVSVCIPVYGVEKYIEKCARSLYEQTMRDGIEFIFVNDCTKDRSIEILEQVLAEYPHRKEQTRIIHHKKNRGLIAARNTGLSYASGEYIIHCDSDDWVELDMYEKMYNAAKENDADMVYCDYFENISSGKQKIITIPQYNCCDTLLKNILSGKVHCSLCNKLFKKDIVLADDIYAPDDICLSEDFLRVSQMLLKCKKVAWYSESFYHYFRERENSYTFPAAYKIEYFNGTCQVVDFLKGILPLHQQRNLANFQALSMFKAIKHKLLTTEDFKNLWSADRRRILFAPNLHIIKRLVILSAFVSYPLTTEIIMQIQKSCFCNILLKIRNSLKLLYYR